MPADPPPDPPPGQAETPQPGGPGGPDGPREDPLEAVITLGEAARRCGLAAHTLTLQAERGRLRARKMGHTWITTPYWLEAYLAAHARRKPGADGAADGAGGA
jgi:hypothetical protein